MRDLTMTGVMFDECDGAPFPTVERVGREPYNWRITDVVDAEQLGWFAVANEPRGYYGDESWEAMDRTNFDAIRDAVGELDGERADMADGVLIVSPDDAELIEELEDLRRRLADYPLLDEDAYGVLEREAWDEWLDSGLKMDTERELRAEYGFTDEQLEDVDDNWDHYAGEACNLLHYSDGFTGEHSPPMAELIAAMVRQAATVGGEE